MSSVRCSLDRFPTIQSRAGQAVLLVLFTFGLSVGGCSNNVLSESGPKSPSPSGNGAGGQGPVIQLQTGGTTASIPPTGSSCLRDGGCADTAPATCLKATCSPLNGQYCGVIGDQCGGKIDCGSCPAGKICEGGRCVGGTDCKPYTCQPTNGRYCSKVGDGCGRELDCGTCPVGQTCSSGVCTLANCVPLTCSPNGIRYCGTIGDGCGGTLSCGGCDAGSTCGVNVPGVCTATNCTPITCAAKGGGRYCGRIGNGCGGVLECPATCPGGVTCGAAGIAHACPVPPAGPGGCIGLECAVDQCTGKSKTTVKGTVYDPAGKLPLYNVMVYVPNAPLDDFPEGVSCQTCDTVISGQPVVTALTDPAGNFTLVDVPVGADIPLVIQTGKWRREFKLSQVKACQDNVFKGTDQFRLPKNQSEGHLPKIAMTRGHADSLECVLRRIGVEGSEFTNPSGPGRVNIYYETGKGTGYDSGEKFPPLTELLQAPVIRKYDMVIFSCHGESAISRAQLAPEKQIVKDYVDGGGRVFGSHFSYGYFRGVPGTRDANQYQFSPWPLVAEWDGDPSAPYSIETGFAKGMAFATWLVNVGASTTKGQIEMTGVEGPAKFLTPGLGQSWINAPGSVPYFHIAMPVEKAATPAEQCGRFVHTGLHVASGGNSGPFPSKCGSAPLSPQEKAWEFLIFELSACALPDDQVPTAPAIPPPGIPNSPPPAVHLPPAPPPPAPPPPPPVIY